MNEQQQSHQQNHPQDAQPQSDPQQRTFFSPVSFDTQKRPIPYTNGATRDTWITVGIGTGLGYNSMSPGKDTGPCGGYVLTHLASGLALCGKTRPMLLAQSDQEAERWLIAVAALADWTRDEDTLRATWHLPALFEQIEDALRKIRCTSTPQEETHHEQ